MRMAALPPHLLVHSSVYLFFGSLAQSIHRYVLSTHKVPGSDSGLVFQRSPDRHGETPMKQTHILEFSAGDSHTI